MKGPAGRGPKFVGARVGERVGRGVVTGTLVGGGLEGCVVGLGVAGISQYFQPEPSGFS